MIIRCFPSFHRTGLRAASYISWEVIFRRDGALDHYPILSTMMSSVTYQQATTKVDPRPLKSFSKKIISIELSFKCIFLIFQLFLLTLSFDTIGRLGRTGSSQTPCKILTLGTEIEKSAGGSF